MKIFVGYGFDRDKWVKELVFPIIEAFGDEVVTGEELQGEQITDAVIQKIKQSHTLIGFATRRKQISETEWTTHRWVTDEISQAVGKIPVIEVRELGVDDQGGIAGDRQRIVYDEKERDKCLVELVKAIGKWHQARKVNLQLLPEECTKEIFPLHRKDGFRCSYTLLVDGDASEEKPTRILAKNSGLFIELKDLPKQALVLVHAVYGEKSWVSNFENADSVGIHLRKE